jgi:hypothetical protein
MKSQVHRKANCVVTYFYGFLKISDIYILGAKSFQYFMEGVVIVRNNKKLTVIDGETLMDMRIKPISFCIDSLLPQGVSLLCGAPKIGKSWLVLNWCVRIAKGEEVWNFKTAKETTLYLCLEDNLSRIQQRLNEITDEVPNNVFFATSSCSMSDGLAEQIEMFIAEQNDTVLVVIDTFQMIRSKNKDTTYANDYQEIEELKRLAVKLKISLLLVHHLRKQGDNDPLNKISGTTGISGAVDTTFILDKSKRSQNNATMICTGRDIEYRELELNFSKDNHIWDLVSDSVESPEILLPEEMNSLIEFMKQKIVFKGTNSEFTEEYNSFCRKEISAKALKQMMNKWRYELESNNIYFSSYRSNGKRFVNVHYMPDSDSSALNDGNIISAKTCVSFVTCDPDEPC